MLQKLLALAVLFAFAAPLAAQVSERKDPREEAEKLRKEGVAFLRETMGDVANMRTLENRISFSAEMAGLMWYHDEREARVMFNSAIADFRELLARLEYQLSQYPEDESASRGMMFGDPSDRFRLETKYRVAMGVRQQIATSIAEHDPEVALSFFYDTGSTNPNRQNYAGRDANFESSLINQIADKQPAKALQFGIRSLERGFGYQHVEMLRKLYAKDAEKGIEFGSRILDRVRSPERGTAMDYAIRDLMSFGVSTLDQSRNQPGRPPVFTEEQLREIAESYSALMLRPTEKFDASAALAFAKSIERFSPARAAQLRARYGGNQGSSNSAGGAPAPPPPPMPRPPAGTNVSTASGVGNSGVGVVGPQSPEEKLEQDVNALSNGKLPKEERDQVVARARKILMQTPGRTAQIAGLSMLAGQVATAGDRELAAEIMRDAERLVNPSPKNYRDFLLTWMVASGYAETDPDRAFVLLEDAIGRANNVISAAVQIAEFVDVAEEIISDGEVQLGGFGGVMTRGLTGQLGVAEGTIDKLVHADFAKTKALTNRFDRPEVRVLAKMLVLRTVLGKKGSGTITERSTEQARDVTGN